MGWAGLFGVDWLIEGKSYSVFSILFGNGFALHRCGPPAPSTARPAVAADAGEHFLRRRALDDPVADPREAVRVGDAGDGGGQRLRGGGIELPRRLTAEQRPLFLATLLDALLDALRPALLEPLAGPSENGASAERPVFREWPRAEPPTVQESQCRGGVALARTSIGASAWMSAARGCTA